MPQLTADACMTRAGVFASTHLGRRGRRLPRRRRRDSRRRRPDRGDRLGRRNRSRANRARHARGDCTSRVDRRTCAHGARSGPARSAFQTAADRPTRAAAMAQRAVEMVRAGITTARDLGGGEWLELELRDRIARGEAVGPRLVCAGQPVTSPQGHCYFWGGEAACAGRRRCRDLIDAHVHMVLDPDLRDPLVADHRRQIDSRRCNGTTRGRDGARRHHHGARPRRRRMARTRVARPHRAWRSGRPATGVRRTTGDVAAGPLLLLGRRGGRRRRCRGRHRPSARTRRRSDQGDGHRRHHDERHHAARCAIRSRDSDGDRRACAPTRLSGGGALPRHSRNPLRRGCRGEHHRALLLGGRERVGRPTTTRRSPPRLRRAASGFRRPSTSAGSVIKAAAATTKNACSRTSPRCATLACVSPLRRMPAFRTCVTPTWQKRFRCLRTSLRLSNVEVLRSATSDCAQAIGLGHLTGRLAAGYSADVLFVDGDPLADLERLGSVVGVLTRGRSVPVPE